MQNGEAEQGWLHWSLLLEVLLVDEVFGLLIETLHSDKNGFQACNG